MDELTDDDIRLLTSSTSSAWTLLPPTCSHNERPLYIKLCYSSDSVKLIVLLTDIYSGIWYEAFDDLRSVNVRIRVSARDMDSQSQGMSDVAHHIAAEKLFDEMLEYSRQTDQEASVDFRSENEVELLLVLPSIEFKLRMDKMPSSLTYKVMFVLLYEPLVGVTNALTRSGEAKLASEVIDEEAGHPCLLEPLLANAMQRLAQAANGIAKSDRIEIAAPVAKAKEAVRRGDKEAKKQASGIPTKVSDDMDIDPDQTIASPPPTHDTPKSSARKSSGKARSSTSTHDSPAKGKGRAKESDDADTGDSSATEDSSNEQKDVDDDTNVAGGEELHKPKRAKRKQQVVTSSDEEETPVPGKAQSSTPPPKRPRSPSPATGSRSPKRKESKPVSPPKRKQDATPAPDEEAASPKAPVIRRPPPTGRGRGGPARRGRGGMQWSNFG